jgi:hypothetical protein
MDIKKWSVKKQILFWTGLTLIQGTIMLIVLFVVISLSGEEQPLIQWILIWIICCLGSSGLAIWRSGILDKKVSVME